MKIIEDDRANINFIPQLTKTKAYLQTQCPTLLKPLTDDFELDVRSMSEGIKTLGVPF